MIDHRTTIRAWKDESFRLTLTDDERSALPESPAGLIDLDDEDLGAVAGGDGGITDGGICATGWPCAAVISIAISKNMSCGACPTTLWSGSCSVSSLGCCPPEM